MEFNLFVIWSCCINEITVHYYKTNHPITLGNEIDKNSIFIRITKIKTMHLNNNQPGSIQLQIERCQNFVVMPLDINAKQIRMLMRIRLR